MDGREVLKGGKNSLTGIIAFYCWNESGLSLQRFLLFGLVAVCVCVCVSHVICAISIDSKSVSAG